MQVMKWSVMALAIAAATSQMAYADEQDDATPAEENISSQAASNGFIEDADLTLLNRNFAFYRNFNHGADDQNYRNEWAHGFMTTFTSGFTQGVIGFGADAFGQVGLKLNSGEGTGGTGLLPVDGSNPEKGQDEYGLAGGAVKARVSETVLAFGQQRPESPVFATGDSRLLPSWATGTTLASDEITDLHIQGGHFYSGSGSASTNQDGELSTVYGGTDFNTADYIGGDYTFNDNLSMGLHASKYEDLWNQYYADLYHTFSFSDDVSLSTSLNYYNTQDTGDANGGEISNNTYSAAFALAVGAQTFTLAHQRVNGDTPFDYLNAGGSDGNSIWLANSVQYSDFNAPGEKSYQARYDLDMTTLGVPGLSFMARYITGSGGNGTDADVNGAYNSVVDGPLYGHGGDEWERDLEVKYVVQEGAAKDLSFRVRQATWRSNNSYFSGGEDFSTGLDEVRIITEYPLDIL
ncbi:OprD family porin [Pseudomonas sp. N040]|uniref:OprD family porin n=1 Tax=Pseudomonas sp. N040 TaxID=2785325 RepID=UPI0018A27D65|nr:OprD family porin [Pseudomonas sp. N040]MBF7729381.1 OprD family porin [Pseudomonas sp. N040]MBW7013021.1 OprD family porin [Pseudomonas sp. N040]